MSRQNKVNPGQYTQRGRLTPDDAAREMMRQRRALSPPRHQDTRAEWGTANKAANQQDQAEREDAGPEEMDEPAAAKATTRARSAAKAKTAGKTKPAARKTSAKKSATKSAGAKGRGAARKAVLARGASKKTATAKKAKRKTAGKRTARR